MICSFNKLFPRICESARVSREENKSIMRMPEQKGNSSTWPWAEVVQQAPELWQLEGAEETPKVTRAMTPGCIRAWGEGRTTVSNQPHGSWLRPALAVTGHKEAIFSAYCRSHYTPGRHICPHPCLSVYGHPCAFYFVIKVSQNTYEIGSLVVYRPWAQSSLHGFVPIPFLNKKQALNHSYPIVTELLLV